MTEKRYFYTEPLAAAWMSEQFGFQYVNDLPEGQRHSIEVIGVNRDFSPDSPYQLHRNFRRNYRFLIHPVSLPLLEVRHGDVALYDYIHPTRYSESRPGQVEIISFKDHYSDEVLSREEYALGYSEDWERMQNLRIILRDGKPFHWPESEAA